MSDARDFAGLVLLDPFAVSYVKTPLDSVFEAGAAGATFLVVPGGEEGNCDLSLLLVNTDE